MEKFGKSYDLFVIDVLLGYTTLGPRVSLHMKLIGRLCSQEWDINVNCPTCFVRFR